MATAPPNRRASSAADSPAVASAGSGRGTGGGASAVGDRVLGIGKEVPPSKDLRERIREAAVEQAGRLDKSQPLARHEMQSHARRLLEGLRLPEGYLGWTMVALASAFWEEQVAAVPYDRRLLLLPRCLRNEEECEAECDEQGLWCRDCGACCLSELRLQAKGRGYKVMIAEGSPAVMKIILGGRADALLGVACLDVLEKTLDKILLAGIPCMAVPLLRSGCRRTTADEDWIRRMIDTPHRPARVQTRTYLHLMRCAAQMFEPQELQRLIPPLRSKSFLLGGDGEAIDGMERLARTEAIAYDFLAAGGKHSRPFITLAVYDALCGGEGTGSDGQDHVARLPEEVKRIALAIEVFHKASLVHDDVEDDDDTRYGKATLHRRYGTATAINVGDYLIGLGYRLVAAQRESLPAGVVAEILAEFAHAHTRLCEGQGAELLWRDARDKRLQPLDALKIYALKTSPAFEAALMAGILLAGAGSGFGVQGSGVGAVEVYREAVVRFARHLGVAYQIINDLDEWWEEGSGFRVQGSGREDEGSGFGVQGSGREEEALMVERRTANTESRNMDSEPHNLNPEPRTLNPHLLGGRPTLLWALALRGLGEKECCELESLLEGGSGGAGGTGEAIARAAELYARADVYRQARALVRKHHERALAATEGVQCEPLRHLLRFLADAILDRRPLAISEEA